MAFPEHLKSDRGQWFQHTYAVFPNGNWNGTNQSIAILDNGDVWMYMIRAYNPFNSFITESSYFGPGEDWDVWIGKVSPEGCERISGDSLIYGMEVENYDTSWNYMVPLDTDTNLRTSAFNTTSWSSSMFTDGVMLYVFENNGVFGTPRSSRMWRIDPVSYGLERIAGTTIDPFAQTVDDPMIDSAVGLDATFGMAGQFAHHEGWIYFPDIPERVSAISGSGRGSFRRNLRRMSTTAPFAVETVLDYSTPGNGYPGDASAAAWWDAINSSTGLPNFFNDDILVHGGSSTAMQVGMVIWEGHAYFLSQGDGVTYAYSCIKRAPLTGGPLECLFYGIGKRNAIVPPSTFRDNQNDSYEYPQGLSSSQGVQGAHWYTGVPDLEGWAPSYDWMAITTQGDLIMPNWVGGTLASSYNQYGTRQIRFRLPELVAYFQANGPQRVNRDNPQWDTIVGGTAFDETPNSRQGAARTRNWTFRDGSTPLMTHQLMPGIAYNLNSPEWRDKVAFIQPVITNDITGFDVSDSTANAMFVSVISETGPGGDLQVNLYFDGVALKGYGANPGLAPEYAPEEVVLT